MRKFLFSVAAAFGAVAGVSAQSLPSTIEVDTAWLPTEVVVPASPLQSQILFIGGYHKVQTTATYGNAAGEALAKQWHDFIGFTPATDAEGDLGWISVNHEMIVPNDSIGDGGGMTAFKVKRQGDTLAVVTQTLDDGRSGEFFNVDFANTVGETGMNCGGIVGPTGRIWTAEEWFRGSNEDIVIRDNDTTFTIRTDIDDIKGEMDGMTIDRYQNFNWLVEIDPKQAKAVRKQYNFGRQPFEGGVIAKDNKTLYTGGDATPGFFTKFVADVAGDFTEGTLYVYKQDDNAFTGSWVEIDNGKAANMLNHDSVAIAKGATMFNRIEWFAYDSATDMVYFTETGRDNPARWHDEAAAGATYAKHHVDRASAQNTVLDSSDYRDRYGRIMVLDPSDNSVEPYLEGGPDLADGTTIDNYPDKHLTNPDGLHIMHLNGKTIMVICEDLNGSSYGRVPAGVDNRTCEMYMLDMADNASINNLHRIAVVPLGAEVTGVTSTPDGKTLLFNSQHPSTDNPFPYNNSLTIAVNGWDQVITSIDEEPQFNGEQGFQVWPNPVAQELRFNKTTDVAIYNAAGQRMRVYRGVNYINVSTLETGVYYVRTVAGETQKIVVE